MVIIALVCLVLGVLCGLFFFSQDAAAVCSVMADYALYFLMFAVGVSVGGSRDVFKKLRQYHVKILIIPLGITAASIAAGFFCSWFTGYAYRDSLSITSGMGWYSLAGVMLTSLAGAQVGAAAFLSNLMRELLSFAIIPPVAKHLNYYTAIAPAGATSEDTTLPMLVKYTNEEVVVMAVFNGVLCSAAVPVLIRLIYRIF